jgi:transcriptional regulator with XRE-family HTH domain
LSINGLMLNLGMECVTLAQMSARSFRQRLGDRLRFAREARRLSKTDVREQKGWDYATIARMEYGEDNPAIKFYEEYAEFLGVSFEQICREALAEPLEVPFSARPDVQRLARLIERQAELEPEYVQAYGDMLARLQARRDRENGVSLPPPHPDRSPADPQTPPAPPRGEEPPPPPDASPRSRGPHPKSRR